MRAFAFVFIALIGLIEANRETCGFYWIDVHFPLCSGKTEQLDLQVHENSTFTSSGSVMTEHQQTWQTLKFEETPIAGKKHTFTFDQTEYEMTSMELHTPAMTAMQGIIYDHELAMVFEANGKKVVISTFFESVADNDDAEYMESDELYDQLIGIGQREIDLSIIQQRLKTEKRLPEGQLHVSFYSYESGGEGTPCDGTGAEKIRYIVITKPFYFRTQPIKAYSAESEFRRNRALQAKARTGSAQIFKNAFKEDEQCTYDFGSVYAVLITLIVGSIVFVFLIGALLRHKRKKNRRIKEDMVKATPLAQNLRYKVAV